MEKLRNRLAQTENRELTPRQAEIYYLGALHLRDHGGEEYESEKDFIDQIIEINEKK